MPHIRYVRVSGVAGSNWKGGLGIPVGPFGHTADCFCFLGNRKPFNANVYFEQRTQNYVGRSLAPVKPMQYTAVFTRL